MPLTNQWPTTGSSNYVAETQAVIDEIEAKLDIIVPLTIFQLRSGAWYGPNLWYGRREEGSFAPVANQMVAVPFCVGVPGVITDIACYIGSGGDDYAIGLYADSGDGTGPDARLASGTGDGSSSGWKTTADVDVSVEPGVYWLGVVVNQGEIGDWRFNDYSPVGGNNVSDHPRTIAHTSNLGSATAPNPFVVNEWWTGGGVDLTIPRVRYRFEYE